MPLTIPSLLKLVCLFDKNPNCDLEIEGRIAYLGLPWGWVVLDLVQWLGCRPGKQLLVSAWVRTPSLTADHFHSPRSCGLRRVIKGVGCTPPASVPLEVRG